MTRVLREENTNKPMVFTTDKGASFELHYSASQLYHFKGKGVLPQALEGGFTGPCEARSVFNRYNLTQSPVSYSTGEEDLETLTKAADLRKWAEVRGIEIPKDKKAPTAIQKFLKEQVA